MNETALRDLVCVAVREVIDSREQADAKVPAQSFSFWEPQAAELLGIRAYALRDLCRQGRIAGSRP